MMFRYLFNSKRIAIAALTTMVIASMIIATLIIGSGENMSEIDKAANAQRNVFIVYILSLAITIFLSVIVWTTSNKYQDAIKADADARIATATQKAAEANEKAEAERLERVRLEVELAPRTLEQRQSAQTLLQFQGMNVIIESLAESEPWRIAGQIAYTLDKAKWNVLPGMKRFLDATHFFDGVAIEANVGARPRDDRSGEAADALVAVLTKNKIQAHRRPSADNLPLNTIKIRVGLKPAEYFQRDRKDLEFGNMLYK